jgi:uncharacterized protein
MNILKELLSQIPAEPIPVRRMIMGVHWTLVSSKYCGLGSTMVTEKPHGQSPVREVGLLHTKTAQELAQWILSDNLQEASIGIAAINSLLDYDETHAKQVNAAEILAREGQGKNIAIVGHFPFVDRLKTIAKNCWVIEKRPVGDDYSENSADELISQSQVVAITATAFINHTIENLLSFCRPDALVMVLGPSTPLSPALFEHGISILSGSRIVDEDAAILTIQQGAIFPQVKGVQLVTLSKGH